MFSINAAKRMGIDRDAGSIAPGKYADLVILDQNPFDMPLNQIHKIEPSETWIAGKPIFVRKQP